MFYKISKRKIPVENNITALNLKENYFDTEIKNGDYLLNGKPIKPSSTLNLIKEISNSTPERKPKFIK